jgi:hypothetical protein
MNLWIAQFSQPSGENEYLVLFDEKPTASVLEEWKEQGCTLNGVFELEHASGSRLTQLPTERALAAKW